MLVHFPSLTPTRMRVPRPLHRRLLRMRTTLARPCVDTISLYWSGSLTSYANIVLGRVTDLDCGYCFFRHMDIDLFDKLRTQSCEINIHDPGTRSPYSDF